MAPIILFIFSIGTITEIWFYVTSFLLYTCVDNVTLVFVFLLIYFLFHLGVSVLLGSSSAMLAASTGQSEDAGPIIFDVPQRWECDILHERTVNETSFKLPVHICLRFTLWCICHLESIWFNLISVPGHTTILCAFSVTIAYGVQPTDSSANEGV